MDKTYLSISITYYSTAAIAPVVHYYRDDSIHPVVSTWDKLTVAEANKLMWELIKLGAKNTYSSNMFQSSIHTRQVTFWGRL